MTDAERDVKRIAHRLRTATGDLAPTDRLYTMYRLLDQAANAYRVTGRPDPDALVRLAAHATVWTEHDTEGPRPDVTTGP